MSTVIIVKPYRICNAGLRLQHVGIGEVEDDTAMGMLSTFYNA